MGLGVPGSDTSGNASRISVSGALFFKRDIVNAKKILLI